MADSAADRWSRIILQHEASGLSVREFATRNRINPSTLSWWRWELGRTHRRTRSSFVEVVVEEPSRSGVSLQLEALGVRLEVDEHTDLELLRRVLEALC
jgi:transposase-like protein